MTRCTAGEKPDAGDPADRAAVDAVFEDLAEAIAGRPPEEKANIETRFRPPDRDVARRPSRQADRRHVLR